MWRTILEGRMVVSQTYLRKLMRLSNNNRECDNMTTYEKYLEDAETWWKHLSDKDKIMIFWEKTD